MTKNTDVLPLLEWLNKSWEDRKELGIWHRDSEMLRAIGGSFVVLLVEAAYSYDNKPTKSTSFQALGFYRFGDQLMKNLYDSFEEFN